MTTSTYRPLSIDLLPDTIAIYGDGEYGAYIRYTDGAISVWLCDEDTAADLAATLAERADVAHTEVIARS